MNIVANAKDAASIMEISHRDRFLVPVPFSHLFGCVLGIALTIVHGASIVIIETFEPEDILKTIEKEKCTVCHGVPTMFIRELEVLKIRKYNTDSLRTGIIAGAPCPVDTMQGIMNVMKCNICIGYGLTECSLVTMTSFEDTLQQRVESVGRPLPNVEVRIVDDDHNPVALGEMGELACKGYNVMKGYYKMPEQTAETIDNEGWLYTGDLATVDEFDYYKIVGRKKDMVIVGGFNVYPRELEEYLISDPKIQQVAVVGVPDHDLGELIAAVIIPEPRVKITGQEIVDLCYGKMASAKVPRYVFIEKELPVSSRGKVQKYILRKKLAEKIEKEGIKKLVPSEVKMKKRRDTMETTIDKLMATGKFNPEQKDDIKKLLLSLNEEQDALFKKLVLDKSKVLKTKK
jgi:fatty-acyl-CoA synthase